MRLVLDCGSIGHRIAHTVLNDLVYSDKNRREVHTGVIFGFMRQILMLAEKFNTNQFIFCWDSRKSYRKLIYPEYKANRRKDLSEEDKDKYKVIFSQFDRLRKEVLPALGFRNVFCKTGYEADDLIACIVQSFSEGFVVVSQDNDLWQLLRLGDKNYVIIYDLSKKEVFTYYDFVDRWGVEPCLWTSVKSIAGCSVDNVIGIKGVGELTAVKCIKGLLKGRKKESIDTNREVVERNRRLVSLPFRGAKPLHIENLQEDVFYSLDFMDVFTSLGFNSFLTDDSFEKWKSVMLIHPGRRDGAKRK